MTIMSVQCNLWLLSRQGIQYTLLTILSSVKDSGSMISSKIKRNRVAFTSYFFDRKEPSSILFIPDSSLFLIPLHSSLSEWLWVKALLATQFLWFLDRIRGPRDTMISSKHVREGMNIVIDSLFYFFHSIMTQEKYSYQYTISLSGSVMVYLHNVLMALL